MRISGSQGVLGTYGQDLTDDIGYALGRAGAKVLAARGSVPRFCIGRDTRASGIPLERALVSGIQAGGGQPISLGVVPTAAVSHCVRAIGAHAGAMITASHRPARDNGIALLGPDGAWLPEDIGPDIEGAMRDTSGERTADDAVGPHSLHLAAEDYLTSLVDGIDDLDRLRVVADCANGATYRLAPEAYRRAGAAISVIGADPDGTNIDAGFGPSHPAAIRRAVIEAGAAIGIAHSGDGAGILAVDELGELVAGDRIAALLALDAARRDALPGPALAAWTGIETGVVNVLEQAGIRVVSAASDDRQLVEKMRAEDISIGVHSSRLFFRDHVPVADGIRAALRLLDVVARSGGSLAELTASIPTTASVTLTARVRRREAFDSSESIREEIRHLEAELGPGGKVVVRLSGTEPLVRVMVEASSEGSARSAAERLIRVIEEALR